VVGFDAFGKWSVASGLCIAKGEAVYAGDEAQEDGRKDGCFHGEVCPI